MLRIPFFSLLLLFACSTKNSGSSDTGISDPFTDSDADADGDADADADADGDADADADSDVDIPYLGWEIEGRIDYVSTVNDSPVCDSLVGFTGTSYKPA